VHSVGYFYYYYCYYCYHYYCYYYHYHYYYYYYYYIILLHMFMAKVSHSTGISKLPFSLLMPRYLAQAFNVIKWQLKFNPAA
jgi:hypothetical protein